MVSSERNAERGCCVVGLFSLCLFVDRRLLFLSRGGARSGSLIKVTSNLWSKQDPITTYIPLKAKSPFIRAEGGNGGTVPPKYLVFDFFPRPIICSYLVIATKSKSREPGSLRLTSAIYRRELLPLSDTKSHLVKKRLVYEERAFPFAGETFPRFKI